jgi:hypothetical protein
MTVDELAPVLQLAIGPVIVISGVGMILLFMTNRFARVIDRSRELSAQLETQDAVVMEKTRKQLRILLSRARIIRAAVTCGALSILLAAILVVSLFLGLLFELAIARIVALLFIACMVMLIAAIVLFIAEVNASLRALWLEVPEQVRRT